MVKQWLQDAAMATADGLMAVWPRPLPDRSVLKECKIISHRGEHDNRVVMENTLPAFNNARAVGVWGLECDIRFTQDLVPVICHDPDAKRVFGVDCVIAQQTFAQLREKLPLIPSLMELIDEFGGDRHLMLELKSIDGSHYQQKKESLQQHLKGLRSGRDFHILALEPRLFSLVDFLPPASFLPVAELNVGRLGDLALAKGYAGLSGHFLLLGRSRILRHKKHGQTIATGFPGSKNCLFRELNRGVDWVFSNDAVALQEIVNRSLAGSP